MAARYDIDSIENRDPRSVERFARWVKATITRYHRAEVRGLERISTGGALYVGNHSSFAYTPDTWILGAAVYYQRGLKDVPYGLAHEVILGSPLVNRAISPLGAVRASHANGERLLRSGKKVLVYPGGDLDAMRPFRKRNEVVFGTRTGFVRLAVRTGVPIIPVVAAGAHSTFIILDDLQWLARLSGAARVFRVKVWPLTLSIPWGLTLGPPLPWLPFPSKILIEVLDPITLDHLEPADADNPELMRETADQIRNTMQAALSRLAAERRR